jgi:hypothetical protein
VGIFALARRVQAPDLLQPRGADPPHVL